MCVCVYPPVSLRTYTGVAVDGVDTLSTILTLVLGTVIKVLVTVVSSVAWSTLTPVDNTHTPISMVMGH